MAVHFSAHAIATFDVCFGRWPDDMTFDRNSKRLSLHARQMFAHVVAELRIQRKRSRVKPSLNQPDTSEILFRRALMHRVHQTPANRAIGRRLMDAVHQRAAEKNFAGVRLIQAGFHARSLSLYAKLGYDVREHLACMQGKPLGISIEGHVVRPAAEADVEGCNRVCREVHGHNRAGELRDAIAQGFATIVEHDRRITGYATIIGFFGHVVGETNEDVKALIGAAKEFAGPGFLLPTRNGDLFRWCLNNGLQITQPMTLMSKGLYNEPAGAFLPSILY